MKIAIFLLVLLAFTYCQVTEDLLKQEEDVQQKAITLAIEAIRQRANLLSLYQPISQELVSKKIVAGVIYTFRIKFGMEGSNTQLSFLAKVWVKVWENFYEVQEVSNDTTQQVENLSATTPGGYSDYKFDSNSALDNEAMKLVLQKAASSNDNFEFLKMIQAQKQLVAGYNLRLTFELVNKKTQKQKECVAVIFVQSWLNTEELISYECGSEQDYKPLPMSLKQSMNGGPIEYQFDQLNDMTDAQAYKTLATYCGQKNIEISKIVSASKQLVAGLKLKLVFEAKQNGKDTTCEASIFMQAWKNYSEVSEFNCGVEKLQSKQPKGGYVDYTFNQQNDPIDALAYETLLKYSQDQKVQIVSINKAQKQLVAGTNVKLSFEAVKDGKNVQCISVIFIQPWNNIHLVSSFTCE